MKSKWLRVVFLLCGAAVALSVSFPGAASETESANLVPGATTQDGRLTVTTVRTVMGAARVSLRNNDFHTMVVDAYTVSRGSSFSCGGRDLTITGNGSQALCTVSDTGAASLGHGSLQVSLTWHEAPPRRRNSQPSPSPSPLWSLPPLR